jgi:16S rRNA (adenine1518-N6/adenine1519-N6)-dimethyltransferase
MSDKDTLSRLGIEPKKSLGQYFMAEPAALQKLVDAARLDPGDAVLEIGPGLGALTDLLAKAARRLVAVEIDVRVIPYLQNRYAAFPNVEIVQADILDLDLEALLGSDAQSYKVVANLPYYITSPILRRLLEGSAPPSLIVVTTQLEVARRMAAQPGEMSLLAVGIQFYGRPEIVSRLKPGVFYPRPGVESAIVRVTPHPGGSPLPADEGERFFRVVRAGFGQPRKQLRNTLSAGLHVGREAAAGWLEEAGVDPKRRAETLSVDEWLALYRVVDNHQPIRAKDHAAT